MWEGQLSTKWAGREIQYYEELDSTNLAAARAGEAGAVHGMVIAADRQTKGRGRRGRTWESPAGKNLYFSLLLRPEFALEKASMLTLVMAHSTAKAIETVVQAPVDIKWPNDILVHGKKICGILTELKAERGRIRHIIIGVGVNVKTQEFAGELALKATSLQQEFGMEIEREELLRKIMENFEIDYEAFTEAGNLASLCEEYHQRLLNKDAFVKVLDPQNAFEGIARGITDTGELIVERADGSLCQVYAGEVSVRGQQGYV